MDELQFALLASRVQISQVGLKIMNWSRSHSTLSLFENAYSDANSLQNAAN